MVGSLALIPAWRGSSVFAIIVAMSLLHSAAGHRPHQHRTAAILPRSTLQPPFRDLASQMEAGSVVPSSNLDRRESVVGQDLIPDWFEDVVEDDENEDLTERDWGKGDEGPADGKPEDKIPETFDEYGEYFFAENVDDVSKLRMSSFTFRVLEDIREEAVQAQILKQAGEIFAVAAKRSFWTDRRLKMNIANYMQNINRTQERLIAQSALKLSRSANQTRAAKAACRLKEAAQRKTEVHLAKVEYWSQSYIDLHRWLAKNRVEKCANRLARIRERVVAEFKTDGIKSLEQKALRYQWDDEKYTHALRSFVYSFEKDSAYAIDGQANSLLKEEVENDRVERQAELKRIKSLDSNTNWRTAGQLVRNNIVQTTTERGSLSKETIAVALKEELVLFKQNYFQMVNPVLQSVKKTNAEEKERVLQTCIKKLKRKIEERKADLLHQLKLEGPFAKEKVEEITDGLQRRFVRETEKMRHIASLQSNPVSTLTALEKESTIHDRFLWLQKELKKYTQKAESKSEASFHNKVAIINNTKEKSPACIPHFARIAEARILSKRLLTERKNTIHEAEMAFVEQPIYSDPLAGERARSRALKKEVDTISQTKLLSRIHSEEAPYRFGKRRLRETVRASEVLTEHARQFPSEFISVVEDTEAISGTISKTNADLSATAIPQLDPLLLGIDKTLLRSASSAETTHDDDKTAYDDDETAHDDVKHALLDLKFVHERQSRLTNVTREKLRKLSAESDPKLTVPIKDTKDWNLFSGALRSLASRNKCGPVYNKPTSSFGVCCLFTVTGVKAKKFSFCSNPELMSLPPPTETTKPECGIQYALPVVMSLVSEEMRTTVINKLTNWEGSKVQEAVDILRVQEDLRLRILKAVLEIDVKTNSRLYKDFAKRGGYSMSPDEMASFSNTTAHSVQKKGRKRKEHAVLHLMVEFTKFDIWDDLEVVWREVHETRRIVLEALSQCSSGFPGENDFLAAIKKKSFKPILTPLKCSCQKEILLVLQEYRESIAYVLPLFDPPALTDPTVLPISPGKSTGTLFSKKKTMLAESGRIPDSSKYYFYSYSWSYRYRAVYFYSFQEPRATTSHPTSVYYTLLHNSCRYSPTNQFCNSLCCDGIQMYSPTCQYLLASCY